MKILSAGAMMNCTQKNRGKGLRLCNTKAQTQTVDQKRSRRGKSRGVDTFLCGIENILKEE